LHWVLADQVLVSGCNFAITILYARFFGPASFGTYALITVAQQYFVSVSVSLVGNPLITTAPHVQDDIERARLIQGSFAAQLIVGAALAFLAAAGMSICLLMGVAGVSAQTVAALAASTLGLATLEWMRRLCFLNRDGSSLLRFDAITYLPIVVAAIRAGRPRSAYPGYRGTTVGNIEHCGLPVRGAPPAFAITTRGRTRVSVAALARVERFRRIVSSAMAGLAGYRLSCRAGGRRLGHRSLSVSRLASWDSPTRWGRHSTTCFPFALLTLTERGATSR
jgi:hypothetical protein